MRARTTLAADVNNVEKVGMQNITKACLDILNAKKMARQPALFAAPCWSLPRRRRASPPLPGMDRWTRRAPDAPSRPSLLVVSERGPLRRERERGGRRGERERGEREGQGGGPRG